MWINSTDRQVDNDLQQYRGVTTNEAERHISMCKMTGDDEELHTMATY